MHHTHTHTQEREHYCLPEMLQFTSFGIYGSCQILKDNSMNKNTEMNLWEDAFICSALAGWTGGKTKRKETFWDLVVQVLILNSFLNVIKAEHT